MREAGTCFEQGDRHHIQLSEWLHTRGASDGPSSPGCFITHLPCQSTITHLLTLHHAGNDPVHDNSL